jgi:hypothetical protein
MLDSVIPFEVPTRIRELELSITRRLRDVLRPHIANEETLEATTRELLQVSRDHAGSFHAINDRARIRREQNRE